MMRIVSSLILICAAAAFAVVPHGETVNVGIIEEGITQAVPSIANDLPDGIQYGEYYPPLDGSTLADPNDPSSNTEYMPPVQRIISRMGEGPVYFSPGWDWYNDILIYGGQVGTGQDWDVDELTGDIYAVFDTDNTTLDSLVVMKSTDGGNTWSSFMLGTNTDGAISNPRVVVARSGGTTWVTMLGIWNETSGDDVLWTRRANSSGSGMVWEQVTADAEYADLDADVGATAYTYVTYIPDGTNYDVWAGRNALAGAGWVNVISLFTNTDGTYPYPAIAAGAGGNVSVGFIDTRLTTNDEFRIKRSTNNGSSWLGSAQVSNNSGGFELTWLDLTFNHLGTQVGWMIAEWAATDDNIAYYYTTDSGVSWSYGGVIGHVDDETMPSVRAGKSTSAVTLAYNGDPGDSTMFSWASSSTPTTWSVPVRINDSGHSATGNWPPTAGWISAGGNWSAVMFTCWTLNYSLYFDWFGNTGIEEGVSPATISSLQNSPNPFSGSTRIDFNLSGTGPVSLEVFDVSGRHVSTPIDGQSFEAGDHSVQWDAGTSLAPGVYFSRLTSGDQVLTQRMVLMP